MSRSVVVDDSKFKSKVMALLDISDHEYRPDLKMEDVAGWDSVGHLSLIFGLEEAFGVRFKMEHIPQLDSLEKIKSALTQEGQDGRDHLA
ncbi:acyl carrier protein [Microvirga sp. VF16]|uniref:acyl carrier protein n=1 Tax=Microvirga sp. VF16 TaxID=2807101 RepID=UPI00193CF7B3|nr:acyl carrier protein [Microvirga sp. VF16]QRM27262.1 acyl carrier protein [Microvirga sp. VF16]